jgi:uncharacterized SAM-binding protein YcdF (DUF218 family)
LGSLAALALFGLRRLGGWLVVSDPLKPASAVAVLSGSMPFRAMEAAKVYNQGWTREVWVTSNAQPRGQAALIGLGIKATTEDVYSVQVLEKMGVPSQSIRLLGAPVLNTEEEVRLLSAELRRVGGDRIILVTSRPHTRRVKAIWHALVGDTPEAIVRGTTNEPFDASHWWRSTSDAGAVGHECMGLLNAWLGFPARSPRP